MNRDINNFDYLSISVKSERLDKIIYCYEALGWREEKREEDKKYYDMKYLLLSRPHNIPNKDRLQYLQVKMETKLNYLSCSNAYRHKGSFLLGLFLTVLGLCLLACGLFCIFGTDTSFSLPLGITLLSLGLISLAAQVYPYTIMRKKEGERATEKINTALKQIEEYVAEAEKLYGAPADTKIDGEDKL
jgi:hypothetical protein